MKIENSDLTAIVARALGVEESVVTESAEVGHPPEWDSLGHLRVCLAVEERFAVGLGLEEIAEVTSIQRLKNFLQNRASAGDDRRNWR